MEPTFTIVERSEYVDWANDDDREQCGKSCEHDCSCQRVAGHEGAHFVVGSDKDRPLCRF